MMYLKQTQSTLFPKFKCCSLKHILAALLVLVVVISSKRHIPLKTINKNLIYCGFTCILEDIILSRISLVKPKFDTQQTSDF